MSKPNEISLFKLIYRHRGQLWPASSIFVAEASASEISHRWSTIRVAVRVILDKIKLQFRTACKRSRTGPTSKGVERTDRRQLWNRYCNVGTATDQVLESRRTVSCRVRSCFATKVSKSTAINTVHLFIQNRLLLRSQLWWAFQRVVREWYRTTVVFQAASANKVSWARNIVHSRPTPRLVLSGAVLCAPSSGHPRLRGRGTESFGLWNGVLIPE